ncbi:hypothetical protein LMG3431_00935 [Achromobacter pestifer]|uniref:Uncharacterized protein n=1 Tax=Achromobacter pestifer TaxID=1353889 RepID=A0A6S6YQM5_9BURK|nr:hypothetical protein LMG3431_00935 [Achromobacter pestifer]
MMRGFPLAAQAEVPGNQGLYPVPYSQYQATVCPSRPSGPRVLDRRLGRAILNQALFFAAAARINAWNACSSMWSP